MRPNPEQLLRCPRCDSTNTKFCYYNNYSLTQPRYFCKGCRRYWTQGGSLRNVPIGGGCRKNKRSTSSVSSSATSTALSTSTIFSSNKPPPPPPQQLVPPAMQLPPLSYDPNDLSLAFLNTSTAGFLDILRGGYYGFGAVGDEGGGGGGGEGSMVLPFDGGLMNSSTSTTHEAVTTTTAATTVSVWPEVGGAHAHGNGNLGVDPVLRDYWKGVGNSSSSSNWHGLINSSLM